MIKRILVGLSGTPYTASAVRTATELARIHRGSVTGITIVDVHHLEEDVVPAALQYSPLVKHAVDVPLRDVEERVTQTLEEFRGACADAEVPHEVRRETGEPLSLFLSEWRYHDLAILGLRGLFDYGLLHEPHDALYRLFSHGVDPIIAVAKESRPIRRALVAYHGTVDAAKAMKRFLELRLWPDLELHLVCFEKTHEEAQHLLSEAGDYCRIHGFEAKTHHELHPARKALLPFSVELDADIVVLGGGSRGLVARKIFGDTLLTAIRESERPLFLSH